MILVPLLLATLGQAPDWPEFRSPKGGFSVRLPGEPAEAEKETTAPDGKSVLVRTATCQADGVLYAITRVPLPDVLGKDQVAALFRGNQKALLDRVGGTKIEEKAVAKSNYPCRELTFEAPLPEGRGTALSKVRMYLLGTTYFSQTITAPKETFPAAAAALYFDSFRFGGGAAAKPAMKPGERTPPKVKSFVPGPEPRPKKPA